MNHPRFDGDEGQLLRSLAQIDRAPDVTGNVMHRLGYRPGTARLAAKRRRRRALSRCVFLLIFGAAIAGALVVESQRPDLRTPSEETLADALGRDLKMHETELLGSVRLIRGLVAPGFLPEGHASTFAPGNEHDQYPVSQRDPEAGPWTAPTPRGWGGGWRAGLGDGVEDRLRHRAGTEASAPEESGDVGDGSRNPGFFPGASSPGGYPASEVDAPARELIERSGLGPIARGHGRAPNAC